MHGDFRDPAQQEHELRLLWLWFAQVGVDLGQQGGAYMKDIEEATKDLDVQLVFNVAGFMVSGMLHNS